MFQLCKTRKVIHFSVHTIGMNLNAYPMIPIPSKYPFRGPKSRISIPTPLRLRKNTPIAKSIFQRKPLFQVAFSYLVYVRPHFGGSQTKFERHFSKLKLLRNHTANIIFKTLFQTMLGLLGILKLMLTKEVSGERRQQSAIVPCIALYRQGHTWLHPTYTTIFLALKNLTLKNA